MFFVHDLVNLDPARMQTKQNNLKYMYCDRL